MSPNLQTESHICNLEWCRRISDGETEVVMQRFPSVIGGYFPVWKRTNCWLCWGGIAIMANGTTLKKLSSGGAPATEQNARIGGNEESQLPGLGILFWQQYWVILNRPLQTVYPWNFLSTFSFCLSLSWDTDSGPISLRNWEGHGRKVDKAGRRNVKYSRNNHFLISLQETQHTFLSPL